jgi:hypothetical protein
MAGILIKLNTGASIPALGLGELNDNKHVTESSDKRQERGSLPKAK